MKRKWTDGQLIDAVNNNTSVYGVLREIGLSLCGGSHAIVKLRIKQLGLDNSHFTGRGWCKGEKHKEFVKRVIQYPLEQILVRNSTYQNTHALKHRLINEKILKNKCYECEITDWMGEPISLQLHHKDGDRCNNLIENLTILCPNCHSQTPSFAGKSKCKLAE
jgi:Zn finger protein HypA/HybF involved in hydrogenase expression